MCSLDDAGRFAAALVADTIVVVDGEILGKPLDVADAERLLHRLVGRAHVVYTRFAVGQIQADAANVCSRTVETRVFLRSATHEEVRRYAATGEGLDKAGAYAAQGIGSFLIERVEGSYTNVVGLPLCEVVVEMQRLQLLPEFP
jgi:septum formation protein